MNIFEGKVLFLVGCTFNFENKVGVYGSNHKSVNQGAIRTSFHPSLPPCFNNILRYFERVAKRRLLCKVPIQSNCFIFKYRYV